MKARLLKRLRKEARRKVYAIPYGVNYAKIQNEESLSDCRHINEIRDTLIIYRRSFVLKKIRDMRVRPSIQKTIDYIDKINRETL